MVNISDEGKKLYKNGYGQKCLQVTLRDAGIVLQNEDIVEESFELIESICEANNFKFGTANASQSKFKVFNDSIPGNIKDDQATIAINMVEGNTDIEYIGAERFGVYAKVGERYLDKMKEMYPDVETAGYYVINTSLLYGQEYWQQNAHTLIWARTMTDELCGRIVNYDHTKYEFTISQNTEMSSGGTYFMDFEIQITDIPSGFRSSFGDCAYITLSQLDWMNNDDDIGIIDTIKIDLNHKNHIRKIVNLQRANNLSECIFLYMISPQRDPYNEQTPIYYQLYQYSYSWRAMEPSDVIFCICSCNLYKVDSIPLGVFFINGMQKVSNSMVSEIKAYDKLYSKRLDESYTVACGNQSSVQDLMDAAGQILGITFGGTKYAVNKSYSQRYGSSITLESTYPDGSKETIVINPNGFNVQNFDSSKQYVINTLSLSENQNIRKKIYELERQHGIIDKITNYESWSDAYYTSGGAGEYTNYNYETPSGIVDGVFSLNSIENITFSNHIRSELYNRDYYSENSGFGYGYEIIENAEISGKTFLPTSGRYGYAGRERGNTYLTKGFSQNKYVKLRVDNEYTSLNTRYYSNNQLVRYHVYGDTLDKIKETLLNVLYIIGIGQMITQNGEDIFWFYNQVDSQVYDEFVSEISNTVTDEDFQSNTGCGRYKINYIGSVEAYTDYYDGYQVYDIGNNITSINEMHNTEWLMEYSISGSGSVKTTLRKIVSAYYELQGLFFIIGRDGNPKTVRPADIPLYPNEDLYPEETLYPNDPSDTADFGEIKSLQIYDNEEPVKYNGINLYKDNKIIKTKTRIVNDGTYRMYDVKGNFILDNFTFSSEQLDTICNNILDNICGLEIVSADTSIVGLPYVECGDLLHLHDVDRDIDMIVTNRVLKGIQSLTDSIKNKID